MDLFSEARRAMRGGSLACAIPARIGGADFARNRDDACFAFARVDATLFAGFTSLRGDAAAFARFVVVPLSPGRIHLSALA